jgi:protocatechuate 3,4-dioxygenase beta subunit
MGPRLACAVLVACIHFSAVSAAGQGLPPRDRPPTEREGTGVIAGRITVVGTTPAPVRRCRVTLQSPALGEPRVTSTDTTGRYRFDKLPAGSYRIKADKPGLVASSLGARHSFDSGSPVDLAAGQAATADIALLRGAAIEGRIVNGDGEPVQNLVVSASRLAYGPYGRTPAPQRQATTDDLGRFRIHSLPPADYFVEAAPDPMAALTQRDAPGPRPPGLARTYYPGTPRVNDARPVTLAAGRDATGIDFVIATVPLARVSGRILSSAGKATSASMRLQAVGSPPGGVRGSLMPPNNDFVYPAVPPGDYWLMAAALPSAGADPEFTATRITVAGQDLTNVTLTTSPGTKVDGRIEIDPSVVGAGDGAALSAAAGAQIQANTTEFEPPSPDPATASSLPRAKVSTAGGFEFPSLFGPRVFRPVGLPDGYALKGVFLDGREITDTAADFKTALVPRTLGIVLVELTTKTGTVSGPVTNARKSPVPRARVVVFPEDTRQWNTNSRFIKTTESGADGTYSFSGLLPGRYLVCAVEYLDDGAWNDPEVLAALKTIATPVAIVEHGQATVPLRLRATS